MEKIKRHSGATLKHLAPAVVLIVAYESFRIIAARLNNNVDYLLAPSIDSFLFGNLPTKYLQDILWNGYVMWYDFVFYLAYVLHFFIPIGLAILVWKTRKEYYWRVIYTYAITALAAFITFFIFPAAPPWMTSDAGFIEPIVRIPGDIWLALGVNDFNSLYSSVSPNAVAAIPSLHAAWATLLVIFVYKLYGKKWACVASIYPFLIYLGTVYLGEHYAFDVISGIMYAVVAYFATPYIMRKSIHLWKKLKAKNQAL